MSRHRYKTLTVLALAALLLAGCWDRREIEDLGLVLAMGLDKAPGENRVRLTIQLAVPRTMAGAGAGTGGGPGAGGPALDIVERIDADTVTAALRDMESFLNRRLSFVHLRLLVFGRELAESGLDAHIGVLTRDREFRRNVPLLVADTTAEAVMTYSQLMEKEPALFLEDLLRRSQERSARAPRITVHEFMTRYVAFSTQPVLPIVRSRDIDPGLQNQGGPRKPRLSGTAAFRGGTMVGELSAAESEMQMLLSGQVGRFLEQVSVPGHENHQVSVELTSESREVLVGFLGETPVVQVKINAEAEVREIEQGRADLVSNEGLADLERRLAQQLVRRATALTRRAQEELRADIFGWGEYARMRFLDWPSWERYEWNRRFSDAKVSIAVKVSVRRIGMTFQPARPR